MAIDFGSHGYGYTRDLCRAIECYTADAVKRRSGAYLYRGMQLQHAVERWLYIQCINSPALFRRYLAQKDQQETAQRTSLPLTNLETRIADFFPGLGPLLENRWTGRAVRVKVYQTVRRAYGWLRSHYGKSRSPAPTIGLGAKILFHIVNAKFARYLDPVTQHLDEGDYAYLAACDQDLGHQLRHTGRPVISWQEVGVSLQSIFPTEALSEFMQLMHEADATYAALRALQPSCVVVVEGNAPLDVITAEACRLLGIPCVCIQQGWSPYVHSGFRNMDFTEMLVWGEEFARLLSPHNPGLKFRVTGSHALQTDAPAVRNPAAVAMTLGFFLQAPCALLGLAAFDAFVDMIDELAAAHPQVHIIVREHPGYPLPVTARRGLAARGNIRFSDPASEQLADVIRASDMVVSVFSTVLLEALALNVVPLICSIGSMKHYAPDLAALGAAIEVDTIAGAREVLDGVIRDPACLSQIRARLPEIAPRFFQRGDAAGLIAQHLRAAADISVSGR